VAIVGHRRRRMLDAIAELKATGEARTPVPIREPSACYRQEW
jgi:hypothetical protein